MARSKSPLKPEPFWRPTREQLAAAHERTVPDLIRPGLRVLFVGINPGLYTAAIGHHFGRPGNRFWPALHAGGFTPSVFSPFESTRLLELDLGITNLVKRATAMAHEVTTVELLAGAARLRRKIKRYRPEFAAVLGLTSYRIAFQNPMAVIGLQSEKIGDTRLWLLPNPSGLNAHHQPVHLARLFRELAEAAGLKKRAKRSVK